jgi:hypothetical protein
VSESNSRAFLDNPVFLPPRDEVFDASEFDGTTADAAPAGGREGLPPSFRMRHDEHYVDFITSHSTTPPVQLIAVEDIDGARPASRLPLDPLVESIRSFGIVQPLLVRRRQGRYQLLSGSKRLAAAIAAGLTHVPCMLREVDDERASELADAENLRIHYDKEPGRLAAAEPGLPARAVREIIDGLVTIESCLNLFFDRERPLRERVAASLAKVEAHRALWLAEAYTLLHAEPDVRKKRLRPASLIGRTFRDLEAEARLARIEVALTVDEPMSALVADEHLMALALTGAAGAMLGLLQGAGGTTVEIRVGTDPTPWLLAFEFSQNRVAAPEARLPGPDDPLLPDWPGGLSASLGLAVAGRVMQLHGGRVEIRPSPPGGCTLALVLPAGE